MPYVIKSVHSSTYLSPKFEFTRASNWTLQFPTAAQAQQFMDGLTWLQRTKCGVVAWVGMEELVL